MDQTTLATLDLLESRLLRIEQLLYGQTASPSLKQDESATQKIGQLERRFGTLVSRIRVYGELLKICTQLFPLKSRPVANECLDKSHPDFFHSAAPSDPPSSLSPEALQSIVLASASSYTAILSSLTAIKDSPIPDPSESATLITLGDRMKAIRATQLAQATEMAELRKRSEILLRSWYQGKILDNSRAMADLEGRAEMAERQVRRAEREADEAEEL